MATPDTGGQGIVGLSSLFGGLGLTGNPVKVFDTDSGVGVDGSELAAQAVSDSDSGVGIEGTEAIDTSNAADVDAGVAVETESLDITLEGDADHKDSGTGADTEAVVNEITSLESGKAVDTEAIAVSLTSTDSGVASESEAITFPRKLTITIDSISQSLVMTITYEGG